MEKECNKIQIQNFIQLLQSVLEENQMPHLVQPDWELIYRLSKAHNVVSLGYEAMCRNSSETEIGAELRKKWKYESDQCTYHCMYQQSALEELMEAFEKEKISVILLKGAVLRDFYPRADLRSMADIDVLIRMEDIECVRACIRKLGYKGKFVDSRNEDVYSKDAIVTLEVHRELFWKKPSWNEYFRHVWERTDAVSGYRWVQKMQPSDFYLHLLGHLVHHMESGGLGIKAFLDIWMFKKQYKNVLDTEESRMLLKQFQMERLDMSLDKLFEAWKFEGKAETFTEEWTDFIMKSGAFGEVESFILMNPALRNHENLDTKKDKWIYIWRRLFPSCEEMKNMYPKMNKCLYLYYAGKRIFKNGICRFSIIKKELDHVKKLEDGKRKQLYKLYEKIGIPPSER